ncbi:lipopolysaccharide biosynthesis protein [Corynebacterium casei]|uniref:lipopolysaccharide biosynthesis protein n=1 Tax=Corynebacterium casei TaxID=160386 RepID=UPI003FD13B2A
MKNRLFKQFSWILLGRVVAAALQAATVVILARLLGPLQFGVLAAVLGIIIWLQAVADLGMAKLVVRERSVGSSPGKVSGALWVNSGSTVILGLILILSFIAAGILFDEVFFLMLPLAISAASEKNADTWLGVAIADGDTHLNSLNLVGRRALALAGFLLLTSIEFAPILAYSVAVAVAALCSVVFAHRHVSKLGVAEREPLRITLDAARPFWINTLAVQLRNLDAAIVGFLASPVVAGYYASASKLASPLRMLPTSLAVVVLPHAARTREGSGKTIARLVLLAGTLVGLIYISLLLVVPWLVPMILGFEYQDSIVPLQIVLMGLVFAAFTSLFGAVLQGRGFPGEVATASVATTIYLLVALLVLTPLGGALGAALALATSFALEAVALAVFFVLKILRKESSAD